jgi:hypothetical protein
MGAIHTVAGNSATAEPFGGRLSILQGDKKGRFHPALFISRHSSPQKLKRSARNFEAFPFSVQHITVVTVVICHHLNSAASDDKWQI